jgi:predicted dehydrogenase
MSMATSFLSAKTKTALKRKLGLLPPPPTKAEKKAAARASRRAARVPRWARSEQPGPKRLVKVGMVGAGEYGRQHLRVLSSLDQVEIAALLTTGGPSAAEAASAHGIERVFSDAGEFLAQDDLDCFVVVVPMAAMADVAARVLAAGRPVLLEKPAGLAAEDTARLARTAEQAGTWGMVAMNRRFYSIVDHGLAALADLGPIRGAILEIPGRITEDRLSARLPEWEYDRYYLRNSIHGVDLLRYVMGDARTVHSHAWQNAASGNRAASFAVVHDYGAGVVAVQLDLWDTHGPEFRLKVIAEQGWVEWEPPLDGTLVDRKGSYPIPVDPVDTEYRPGLWSQDLHFIDAVRAGRRPTSPASMLPDALRTMTLIDRIVGGPVGSDASLSPIG